MATSRKDSPLRPRSLRRSSGRAGSARTATPTPAVHAGERVAVVAPGAAVERESVRRGVKVLRRLGYEPVVHPSTLLRDGYLAGPDAERARALLDVLRDRSVRAVFLARGGYGCARLLPLLAPALARVAPKPVVGYSDATALFALLTGRLGWRTVHGPLVANDIALARPGELATLAKLLAGEWTSPVRLTRTIVPGRTEGRLVGGCLSVLVSLLGTPWAWDPREAILLLEDVGEKPYRIDRMLTQLRLAGAFRRVRGIVFGEMPRCGGRTELARVLAERTADLGIPVAAGLPSGHGRGRHSVPLGTRVRLDAGRRTLEMLEPAFEAMPARRK